MPPIDPKLSRVLVSSSETGEFTIVGYVTSFEMTEGSEGESTTRYFGGAVIRAGDPTLSGTLPVLWDPQDTDGQQMLRQAKRTGEPVWLQFAPAGTEAGGQESTAMGEQFEAHITEVSRSSEAGGDNVTGSFSFTGDPDTLTEVTFG